MHADKAIANRLAAELTRHNTHVWVDTWELNVGDSIINRIQEAINESSALPVVLSPPSESIQTGSATPPASPLLDGRHCPDAAGVRQMIRDSTDRVRRSQVLVKSDDGFATEQIRLAESLELLACQRRKSLGSSIAAEKRSRRGKSRRSPPQSDLPAANRPRAPQKATSRRNVARETARTRSPAGKSPGKPPESDLPPENRP
ncbi:MAG: TIR domain-containing protein [bacterium]|nr:TIR domain-containing protein [bacterium]